MTRFQREARENERRRKEVFDYQSEERCKHDKD
jgi:hypothetical protein